MADGTDDTVAAPLSGSATSLPAVDPAHYALGDEIARGGMGRIVAARDLRLDRTVAIKELLLQDPEARARFEREARITARLQHPAIVNVVEAGTWPSGEPFYVMKLVSGESLDKVIAKRATLAERIALVPDILAVARALAYAHKQRVIHRDLKPQNVLVGEFGEIVVVDWGLAKDLDAPSTGDSLEPQRSSMVDRPAPVGSGSGRSLDATVAGAVMGTPAYMPAEQACGDPVDERADVYALGALLYHTLAGEPPYSGKSTAEILGRVISGPPEALATRAQGTPSDLVAIVEKAMAHDARRRYPTAGELASDLERFQTGQLVGAHRYSALQLVARWIRRHRAAVLVGTLAIVALTILGVSSFRRVEAQRARAESERVRAESERARAEARRAEAEHMVEFMMGELRDKLAPLGRIDLLDGIAKLARNYYARPDVVGDPARRATARVNLGDILRAQGDLAGALVEYRAAVALRETSTDTVGLAIAYDRVGDVLFAQRDHAGALAVYRKSLLLATSPHDLSVSHDKIGDVHAGHDELDAALAEYEQAKQIRVASPSDPQRSTDLAAIYERIGHVLLRKKELDGALAHFHLAHAILMPTAQLDPSDANRRDLAASFDRIGDVHVDRDDLAGAMANYRESLALRAALAAKDPNNMAWQRLHSLALDDVADVYVAQSKFVEARALYEQSMAIAITIATKDPTNVTAQRDVGWSHANIAATFADPAERRAMLLVAREVFVKLPPGDPVTQRALTTLDEMLTKLERSRSTE